MRLSRFSPRSHNYVEFAPFLLLRKILPAHLSFFVILKLLKLNVAKLLSWPVRWTKTWLLSLLSNQNRKFPNQNSSLLWEGRKLNHFSIQFPKSILCQILHCRSHFNEPFFNLWDLLNASARICPKSLDISNLFSAFSYLWIKQGTLVMKLRWKKVVEMKTIFSIKANVN